MKEKFLNAVIHNSQNPHTTVVEGAIRHIVKKYKVKEVFKSSLGLELIKYFVIAASTISMDFGLFIIFIAKCKVSTCAKHLLIVMSNM